MGQPQWKKRSDAQKTSLAGNTRKNGTVRQELQELAIDISRLTEEIADINKKFDKLLKELGQNNDTE